MADSKSTLKRLDTQRLGRYSPMGQTVEIRRVQAWMGEVKGSVIIVGSGPDADGVARSDLQAVVTDSIDGRDLAAEVMRVMNVHAHAFSPALLDALDSVERQARSLLAQGTHPADAADEGRVP
jgi:hypothetical protein